MYDRFNWHEQSHRTHLQNVWTNKYEMKIQLPMYTHIVAHRPTVTLRVIAVCGEANTIGFRQPIGSLLNGIKYSSGAPKGMDSGSETSPHLLGTYNSK